MKITFESVTVQGLVEQAMEFAQAFPNHTSPLRTTAEVTNIREEAVAKLGPYEPMVKRGPGRPPKASEKPAPLKAVASKMADLAEEITGLEPSKLVGAAGIEPVAKKAPQVVKITKEDLTASLQKLMEKEKSNAGNEAAGINAVRQVFSEFGVRRLGELDESRYPELHLKVQEMLGL